jgi:FkbM family methyltransferase
VTDYRNSRLGRRRSWYGLKKHVKRFLGWRLPNWALRRLRSAVPSLGRSGRLPAPAHVREVTGRVRGASFVMLRPDRCVVAKELYWGEGRRTRPQDAFAIELFATLARGSDVAIDIGAYTGIFTLVATAVNPDLQAHAFEIVPDVFRALFDNCVRNDVLHRTTLYPMGIGASDTVLRVPASSIDSALPDFFSSRLHFERGVLVSMRSLDSFAQMMPSGARVLVKVDVEGTENDVFEHGTAFLRTFLPDILCEVLAGGADPHGLEGLLVPHGYRFHLVRQKDLLPSEHILPHADFRDWLFTTRTPDELVALDAAVASRD